MSSFKLIFGGIACGFVAALFGVIGVATTSWITMCFPSDSLNKVIQSPQSGSNGGGSSLFGGGADVDMFMCIKLGLFKREDEINGYFRVVTLRTDALSTSVQATGALLIIGVIASFVSICLLLFTVKESIKRKSTREPSLSPLCHGKLGFVLGIIGTLSIGLSIFIYTGAQANTVHNPANFLAQTQNRLSGFVNQHLSSTGSKTDNNPIPDLQNSFDAFENVLDIFSISGVAGQIRSFFTSDSTNECNSNQEAEKPSVEQQSQNIQSLVKQWNPRFGYSFVLTWLAFIISLVSSILVGLAYFLQRSQPKHAANEELNT